VGKTCVGGAGSLRVALAGGKFTVGSTTSAEGEVISIDGTSGRVYVGEVPVQDSQVVKYFEGTVAADASPLVASVHRIISHADSRRRMAVRTNADNREDSARARRFGAEGIGLCRTEHMFLGDR